MVSVRQVVDRLREVGLTVHEWPGWDGRGNEGVGQIDPRGAVLHHTGSAYGNAYQTLVTGRADLPGLLCNFAGNADGTLTVVGSGLAWHAGPGGGPNLGPLAQFGTRLNRQTLGLEIVYPGYQAMTAAQRHAALVFSAVVAELCSGGDVSWIRGHGEVSSEGKWDPGRGDGTSRMIDMGAFRQEASTILNAEDEMLTPNDGNTRWAAANPYLPDNSPNKVETHPVASWVGWSAFHGLEAVRLGRLSLAILTDLANDPDITPAALEDIVRRSDAEHAPVVASMVVAGVNAEISDLVREALEKVQEDDSDSDVAALLRRIAGLVPAPA